MTGSQRLVVLGRAGDMGRFAAKTAIDFDFISEITIADLVICSAALQNVVRRSRAEFARRASRQIPLRPTEIVAHMRERCHHTEFFELTYAFYRQRNRGDSRSKRDFLGRR